MVMATHNPKSAGVAANLPLFQNLHQRHAHHRNCGEKPDAMVKSVHTAAQAPISQRGDNGLLKPSNQSVSREKMAMNMERVLTLRVFSP